MKTIPMRYSRATIKDLPDQVREIVINLAKERKSMFLYGGVGVGKTHATFALANHIGINNVMYLNVPHFLATLRQQIGRGSNDPVSETVLDAAEYGRYLVLDDIGVEKSSDWVFENIYTIINHRYEHGLPTIITSNFDVGEIAHKLGDRVASRIYGMCELVEIIGTDKRLT